MEQCASTLDLFASARQLQSQYKGAALQRVHQRAPALEGASAVDELSRLLMAISDTCGCEFVVIHRVFPHNKVTQIMRELVETLLTDPQLGVDAR